MQTTAICIAREIILENYIILNSEKWNYMCIWKNFTDDTLLQNDKNIKSNKEETILGAIIDKTNYPLIAMQGKFVIKLVGNPLRFHEYQLLLICIKGKAFPEHG